MGEKYETAQVQGFASTGVCEQAFIRYKHAFLILGRSPEDASKLAIEHMRGQLEHLEAKHVLKKSIGGEK